MKKLLLGSSSLEEDSWQNSMAGSFLSVKDINTNDTRKIIDGVEEVIKSYTKKGSEENLFNQVLIQPYISNVSVSGVVFSKTLEDGTPYFCISYDNLSKATDRVTSGILIKLKHIRFTEVVIEIN